MGSVPDRAVTGCAMLLVDAEAVGPCRGRASLELQLCLVLLSNFLIIWVSLTEAPSELHRVLRE